jgi:hypothetical protein
MANAFVPFRQLFFNSEHFNYKFLCEWQTLVAVKNFCFAFFVCIKSAGFHTLAALFFDKIHPSPSPPSPLASWSKKVTTGQLARKTAAGGIISKQECWNSDLFCTGEMRPLNNTRAVTKTKKAHHSAASYKSQILPTVL